MTFERIFSAYPGHFDDRPLVPGAALLAWVQACVPGLLAFDRVRFTAPVVPGEAVRLELTFEAEVVTFAVFGGDEPKLRGSGRRSVAGS